MLQNSRAETRSKHPTQKKLADWRRIAGPQAALLLEISRYDPCERAPAHRRPIRGAAKAIIEGRRAWPRELLPWKLLCELQYYHGQGKLPAWEDERNLTRPQRERLDAEERKWRQQDARWDAQREHHRRIAEALA